MFRLNRFAMIQLQRRNIFSSNLSWWGRVCVLGTLCTLVVLVPLAHASPPDPVWLAGIYDAGDSDDVILAATSLESQGVQRFVLFSQVSLVARVVLSATSKRLDVSLRSSYARAPPKGEA